MQNGPALGEPLGAWQLVYGSALRAEPAPGPPEGYQLLTLTLDGITLLGTAAGPEEPMVVTSLWRSTTKCMFGD